MIELPGLRVNYDWAMEQLAREEIQRSDWPIQSQYSSFDLIIHILFDDMNIEENGDIADTMGLVDQQRVSALAVMKEIKSMWQNFGTEADPDLLRLQPGWEVVMKEAQNYLNSADPEQKRELQQLIEEAEAENAARREGH